MTLIHMDNLDDRREVVLLLEHLAPADRWRFVEWCCSRCKVGSKRPVLHLTAGDLDRLKRATVFGCEKSNSAITGAAYGFLWSLASQYGLDLADATRALVAVVRGRSSWKELDRCIPPPVSEAK